MAMKRSFISMTWTPDVDAEDARELIRTIESIYELLRHHLGTPGQFDPLPIVRVFGAWSLTAAPAGTAYSDIKWYVARSLDADQEHILASRYLQTVILEPWQSTQPHFDLALTSLALTNDLTGAVPAKGALGFSRPGMISLISSKPFASIENPILRNLAMRHIYAHYFGRMLDVPRLSRGDKVIEHEGGRYCTDNCAMRFTDTPTLALSFAQEQGAKGVIFCESCSKDLVAQIAGYYYGLN